MLVFNEAIFRKQLAASNQEVQFKDYSSSVHLETSVPSSIPSHTSPAPLKTNPIEEDRRRGFQHVLKRLSESELAEQEQVKQYLHHMYRTHCQARTIARTLETITWFMYFLRERENRRFSEVSRKDIEAFIERE